MAQPSTIDLQTPFDPTGYTEITGAQLEQLVGGTSPSSDKGIIVATTDTAGNPNVPNVLVTSKWQYYFWLRITATAAIPYVWNPNGASDVVLLQWQTIAAASIGVGTIVGDMIADFTIPDSKIISLSYSKISGAPTGLTPSGAAGGALAGTYPNPSLAPNAVVTASITDLNVTNSKLEAASTTTGIDLVAKVKPNGVGLTVPRTNAGATAIEWVTPASVGARLVQFQSFVTTTIAQTTGAMAANTVAGFTTGTTIPTSCLLAFTPILGTAGSKLIVRCTIPAYVGASASCYTWVALYNGTAFVAWGNMSQTGSNTYTTVLALTYISAALASNTPITYTVYVGCSDATAGFGRVNSKGEGATITIEEYL